MIRRSLPLVALFFACLPDPEPRPPSQALGLEAQAVRACENLRRVGCPEGQGSVGGVTCAEVAVRASSLRPLPLACWAEATNAASAKNCGSLRCVR